MRIKSHINPNGTLELKPGQKQYLAKYTGKYAIIEVDMRTTVEKQGFIEKAIATFFFFQHLPGVYKDLKDARTGLKWATNHTKWELDDKGGRKEVTRSMSEIYASNKKAQEFIDKCQEYFMKNGYEFPDSQHFLEYIDSAPMKGDEYPPLVELKKVYFAEIKKEYPWRK